MSQAANTNITTVFGVTRAQVMSRAWMLARNNRRTVHETGAERFGLWLILAWKEARTGQTQFWQPVTLVEQLRRSITDLDTKDRWSKADYAHRARLTAELSAAQA